MSRVATTSESLRRKALLFVVPGFPSNEAETDCLPAVQNYIKAIAARNRNIAVHVVALHYPFKRGTYQWNDVTVHAIAGANRPFPRRLNAWIGAAWRLRSLLAANDVLAVHSHWLAECTYVASWLARAFRKHHIATIRGQDALAANPYLRHLAFERMTVTAGSDRAAEAFLRSTGRRVDHVIPTGVDSTAFSADVDVSHRDIDILGVGSLSPIKNFGAFVEIIASIAADHPNLRCAIVGDGPERAALEAQIERARLGSTIMLKGRMSREAVLQVMRTSRILLHTALYEGQGYVLLEALASGMSVVCGDVGYTGGSRYSFRCSSHAEMTQTVRRLLASRTEQARESVATIDDTAASFERIYGIA